jgi:predicted  nucleic acid-binding Zn-ribbon protein
MLPDLDRLIRLQRLDTATLETRRTVAAIPERMTALDDRLHATRGRLDDARREREEAQKSRREVEKHLGEVQSRLSRFKDQLMAVKTNKEYTAMQHEIGTAEEEVARLEDTILEQMLQIDELDAAVDAAESADREEAAAVERERAELETRRVKMERELTGASDERARLTEGISPASLRLFESIAGQRQGLAVVEARDGHCTVCNVRLRPQVFNEILLNTDLIRCESCLRVLYHDPNRVPERPAEEPPEDGSAQ